MSLSSSIQQTVRYAKYFSFPLTETDLHHWLISDIGYSKEAISKIHKQALSSADLLRRDNLFKISQRKLSEARQIALAIGRIPFIQLIAVTGSVAAGNAKKTDDLDLFIVTLPDTLWLTRPIVYVLLKLLFKRRSPSNARSSSIVDNNHVVCDNLWFDTTALSIISAKRNLYTAHEILQLVPVFDRNFTYQRFIQANSWVKHFLANAYSTVIDSELISKKVTIAKTPLVVRLLNRLAFRIQYTHMRSKITTESVAEHYAYFHPRDLSHELSRYVRIP